ncbi:hypothetical protein BCR36DRAFT_406742 [Piromyces finnis]|uniref:PH domain-containing protein n=1 Tax=Piromyces finnis TaxID=1754191 RepID=A0A1Y1V0I5_9FUNG|nr:hypothetical protein BCR36DRAFT_406742 [Piromyces finnis]|eukprot:ORX43369.1 hypothetical protein BCR36DRAFT_406742 [Piromyces finnis]
MENEENQGLLAESYSSSEIPSRNVRTSSPKEERQYWIDALRILASYMVVLVHSSSYAIFEVPLFTFNWYGLMFWDAMSRTCVPLFIMISGILFLNPEKEISISKIYKKYISRIAKTLIFWNIFYATIVKYQVNAFNTEYKWDSNVIYDFFSDVVYGKFHMWYLYMCIGLYMVTPLLRAITKDKKIMSYFVILSMTTVQALPFIFNIMNNFKSRSQENIFSNLLGKLAIFLVAGYTCQYVLGYYLSKVEIKNKFLLFLIYVAGIMLLIFTYVIKIIFSILKQKEVTEFGDYNSLNVSVTAIIIFIFFKHTGSKILKKLLNIKGFKFLLLKISQLSFGIYLIHVFYFELFRRLNFNSYSFNSLIFSPIHAFIIWTCSLITISILQYVPYVKNYI